MPTHKRKTNNKSLDWMKLHIRIMNFVFHIHAFLSTSVLAEL